jgi:6-phosphogluconolactonase
MRTLLVLAAFFLITGPLLAGSFVYVSVGDANQIAIYKMDETTGKLEYTESVKMDGAPGALAVDPQKKHLFAAVRTSKKIISHEINKDGTLKMVNTIAVGMNPVYLGTDRTGKFLLSASYSEGKVMVHAIGKDGTLDAKPVVDIATEKTAHCILPDPSNKFVFVPHTTPNAILQFDFDATTGALKPNAVPKVMGGPNAEPRHLWFHPLKKMAYAVNEKASSVTRYTLDPAKGQLTPAESVSTLPKDFKGKNTCAHIEMTPNGKFLYASNRGHNSIAGYAVDAETGKLKSLGQTATEKTPRAFTLDPSGRFLYVAGQDSGKLAAYEVDQTTGALAQFAKYEVGNGPAWVLALTLP